MKLEVGSMKSEGGANHAGEFMRRYSPLITTTLHKLYDTKALGDV
jgi:hypothetical protein